MQTTIIKNYTSSLLLVSILLLASILRFYHVSNNPIMLDEAYSEWFAALSYKEHWTSATEFGIHPVLYYSVLKFWTSLFGDGHIALRSFSTFVSILTLPFVYIFGKNIGGEKMGTKIGLLSTFLVAISPFQIEWSQIARPYSMMTLGITMASAGFSWYLRHNNTKHYDRSHMHPRWLADVCIIIGGSLSLWSHNMSVLFILSIGIYLLWWHSFEKSLPSRTALHLLALGLIIFFTWLPHAYWLMHQTSTVVNNIFYVPPITLAAFGRNLIDIFGSGPPLATMGFTLIMPICWIGLKQCSTTIGKEQTYFLAFLLVIPFIIEIALDKLLMPLMVSKTHVWATIPISITIAFGLLSFKNALLKYSIVTVIFIAYLVGGYNTPYTIPFADWRALANKTLIEDQQSPILIYPNELALPYIYEAKYLGISDEEITRRVFPLPTPFPSLGFDRPTMAGVAVVKEDDVSVALANIDHVSQFWIMASFHPFFDPDSTFYTRILKTHEVILDQGMLIKLRLLIGIQK